MPKKDTTNGSGGPELHDKLTGDVDLGPLLLREEVLARTTLSESQVDLMRTEGVFPEFFSIGARRLVMPERVLDGWFETMVELRDGMRNLTDPVTLPKWSLRLPSGEFPSGLRVVRRPEAEQRVKYRRTHFYRLMHVDVLPKPIPLSVRCRGWLVCELDKCVAEKARKEYGDPVLWTGGTSLSEAERRARGERGLDRKDEGEGAGDGPG